MNILAIDTSCDETSVAITKGRNVLASVIYSQILLHKDWGGVVPSIARKSHEEKIDKVVEKALKKAHMNINDVDAFAVTQGPGLAIALEVGIRKAKELAMTYGKPFIPVNHMEGHLYSCFTQNSKGKPERDFSFPLLTLLISGGHTEMVLMKNHGDYTIIGETVDDAAGEALDKAAKMMGFGYPGGPVLERLAEEVNNQDIYTFPRAMKGSGDLNVSYSGLKTHYLYFLEGLSQEEKVNNMRFLASSFQEAVFDTILRKYTKAIEQYAPQMLVVGGGVSVNKRLRKLIRMLAKKYRILVYFPPYKYLNFDNAAMIGIVAGFKALRKEFADPSSIDRIPRMSIEQ